MECNSNGKLPWAILALFPALLIVCVLLCVHTYKCKSHARAEESNAVSLLNQWSTLRYLSTGSGCDVPEAELFFLIISAEQIYSNDTAPQAGLMLCVP